MELYYHFCGADFRIDTPQPLWEEPNALQFRASPCENPRFHLTLETQPVVHRPEGRFLGRRGEKSLWRTMRQVSRTTTDIFRKQPHMCVTYPLEQASPVRCIVRENAWKWATRSSFFWPGVSLNQLLLHVNALVFHASYICWQGRAILFTAPSQTGKSTQAALWEQYRGAELINGDKAAVKLGETASACGLPFCGTSGVCKNRTMPLRCVVVLSQAPENTVRRLGPTEALPLLCQNLFSDDLIYEEWQLSMQLLLDMLQQVPVYALACRPDEGAVLALEEAMARDGLTSQEVQP